MRGCLTGLLVSGVILLAGQPTRAREWPTDEAFPYRLHLAGDLVASCLGGAVLAAGLSLKATMDAPTEAKISALDRADVPRLDRPATHNDNDLAGTLSDVGISLSGAAPSLLLIPQVVKLRQRWQHMVTIIVMYGEASMWTMGVTNLTKALTKRPRPYMYSEHVSMETKLEKRYTSFFSGHSSFAFTGALFVATVFSDLYPDSPWRFLVWSGSVATAALTGYMRYVAGAHFPSDILTGALVGSLFGFFVPFTHRKRLWCKKEMRVAVLPELSRERNGFILIYSF
jgi:membrane-associated phospholipid phosphatase